jgi:hypothetical protein
MGEVERLFEEYKAAHAAGGEPDPHGFLARVSGVDRAQLAALIDAYLMRAPRRSIEPDQSLDAAPRAVAEALERSLAGSSGLWPALLPRLRNRARIRRADLVAELAARLGAQSKQEKVASYYHRMEQGRLPASGVSDTVLEALGRIVGYGAEGLRKAGEMPAAGPAAPAPGPVFTRPTHLGRPPQPGDHAPREGAAADDDWDEVDRLFRGGPSPGSA